MLTICIHTPDIEYYIFQHILKLLTLNFDVESFSVAALTDVQVECCGTVVGAIVSIACIQEDESVVKGDVLPLHLIEDGFVVVFEPSDVRWWFTADGWQVNDQSFPSIYPADPITHVHEWCHVCNIRQELNKLAFLLLYCTTHPEIY